MIFFRYVGNLHKSTSEFVLRELFKVIGNVTDVKMITHEVRLFMRLINNESPNSPNFENFKNFDN